MQRENISTPIYVDVTTGIYILKNPGVSCLTSRFDLSNLRMKIDSNLRDLTLLILIFIDRYDPVSGDICLIQAGAETLCSPLAILRGFGPLSSSVV